MREAAGSFRVLLTATGLIDEVIEGLPATTGATTDEPAAAGTAVMLQLLNG